MAATSQTVYGMKLKAVGYLRIVNLYHLLNIIGVWFVNV